MRKNNRTNDEDFAIVKFRIIDYFDVWGNAKDGFEINNLCEYKDGFEVFSFQLYTNFSILATLRDVGYLKKGVGLNRVNVFDYYPYIELEAKNGCPIGRIEIIEEAS